MEAQPAQWANSVRRNSLALAIFLLGTYTSDRVEIIVDKPHTRELSTKVRMLCRRRNGRG